MIISTEAFASFFTIESQIFSAVSNNTNKNEALSALETLGFARKQAEKICDSIVKKDANASVEMIIKLALKNL